MDIQNANRILRPPQIIEESYNTYYPSDVVFQQEMGLDALGDGSLGRSMVTQSLRFSKDVLNLFFKGSIPSADIVTDKEFIQILNSIPPEMLARAADDTSSILGVLENDSVKEKLMPYTKISSEMVRRTKDSNYPMLLSIIYNKHYGLKDIVEKTDIETFKKIPEDLVNMFKFNMDSDYNFKYDTKKTLNEQNVSKEAKTIIAILFKNYWATPQQREKIIAKEKYDLSKIEEEKRDIYNPDNLFKKQNEIKEDKIQEQSDMVSMIEYKEPLIKRIINRIKEFFIR